MSAEQNLKALLFDVDGTLAETERDGHRIAFNEAFKAAGLPWHWDVARYGELLAVTGGRERITHFLECDDPEWLERAGAAERIDALHLDKNRHYADRVAAGHIALRPGLLPLLRAARDAGLRLAVVTTTSRSNVDALLQATLPEDLRGVFCAYVTGEDVTRKKPDPECYQLALRQLGIGADEALAIEDSRNGLRSATAASVKTAIIPSVYFVDEDFDGAVLRAAEFTDITLPALHQASAAA